MVTLLLVTTLAWPAHHTQTHGQLMFVAIGSGDMIVILGLRHFEIWTNHMKFLLRLDFIQRRAEAIKVLLKIF